MPKPRYLLQGERIKNERNYGMEIKMKRVLKMLPEVFKRQKGI